MMAKRYRPGTGGWPNASPGLPSPGPWHESQKDLANGNPPSFIAESGRSAEFCPAHLRAKHFGKQQGHNTRNSGQRAGGRSCTRRVSASFYPFRPGPNRRVLRDNDLLRVCLAGMWQELLTAEGIGVHGPDNKSSRQAALQRNLRAMSRMACRSRSSLDVCAAGPRMDGRFGAYLLGLSRPDSPAPYVQNASRAEGNSPKTRKAEKDAPKAEGMESRNQSSKEGAQQEQEIHG